MNATTLGLWALTLLVQNASFTLVSRARNSNSIKYHTAAATISNGIWFVGQFFVINAITNIHSRLGLAFAGLMYVIMTTASSVGMHYFLMKKVEHKIGGDK